MRSKTPGQTATALLLLLLGQWQFVDRHLNLLARSSYTYITVRMSDPIHTPVYNNNSPPRVATLGHFVRNLGPEC